MAIYRCFQRCCCKKKRQPSDEPGHEEKTVYQENSSKKPDDVFDPDDTSKEKKKKHKDDTDLESGNVTHAVVWSHIKKDETYEISQDFISNQYMQGEPGTYDLTLVKAHASKVCRWVDSFDF